MEDSLCFGYLPVEEEEDLQEKLFSNGKNWTDEDDEMRWLEAMDDQFLRDLCSDLFFPSDHDGRSLVALDQQPETGTAAAASSSSAGSGTCTRRRTGHGRQKRERAASEREQSENGEGQHRSRGSFSGRRSRSAEVHNMSERKRRDRINEKMRALQDLIPNCNKTDKAIMLDEAIEYLKSLQLQVQMMWTAKGLAPVTPANAQQQACFTRQQAPPLLDSAATLSTVGMSQMNNSFLYMQKGCLGLQGMNASGESNSQTTEVNPENIQKWLQKY